MMRVVRASAVKSETQLGRRTGDWLQQNAQRAGSFDDRYVMDHLLVEDMEPML